MKMKETDWEDIFSEEVTKVTFDVVSQQFLESIFKPELKIDKITQAKHLL